MADKNYVQKKDSGNILKTAWYNADGRLMSEIKYEYDTLLEELSYYQQFNPAIISKIMVVEIKLTAEGKNQKSSINRTLYLTKEGKEWRVLYLQ